MTPALLERYEQRRSRHLLAKLRLGLGVGALFFGLFAVWELILEPAALPRTLPIRLGSAACLAGLLGVSFFRPVVQRPSWLLFTGVVAAAFGVMLLSMILPHGYAFGTGSLMIVVLLTTALSPSAPEAALSFGLLILASAAVLVLRGAPGYAYLVIGLPILCGSVAALLMCRISDRITQQAHQLEATLERLATTDLLSEALTRRAFDGLVRAELERAGRYQYPVSLVLFDIDHFKRINDGFGHPAGDATIRAVAQVVRQQLRQSELFGRLGGEEFAILAPNTDSEAALVLAERVRAEIARWNSMEAGRPLRVTVSLGVARWRGPGESLEALISRADQAMYRAKQAGRDRALSAEPQQAA